METKKFSGKQIIALILFGLLLAGYINAGVPTIPYSFTGDSDGDGKIDNYKLNFSENINVSRITADNANRFVVSGHNNVKVCFDAAGSDCDPSGNVDGNILYLKFDEGASPDTGQIPPFSYTAGSSIVSYSTSDQLASIASQIPTDKVSPVFVSGVFTDPVLSSGETSVVTFTFSEAVSGFTNADLTAIPNGALTAVSSTDNVSWTATFTPDDPLEAPTNAITITMTGITDSLGNAGSGTADSSNYAIDNIEPTCDSIVLDDSDLKAGETATVTITFSEAVTGFNETDLTAANGNMGAVTVTGNPLIYTGTFTPTADTVDTTNIITVETTWTDVAGNAPLATLDSANYTIDTLRPTVGITSSDYEFKVADTATLTFTFSEEPTGFTVDDVTAANGALTDFTVTGDPLIYTATFTPTDNLEDATNVVTVGVGWTDAAGNAPISTTDSANYTIDTKEPTLTSGVFTDNSLIVGETSLVTFVFHEAVTGFTNDDLTIENGGLTAVSSGDGGITWTATFTPTDDLEDANNVITVAMTGVTDAAGNAGLGTSDTSNYAIDTKEPIGVSVVLNDSNLIVGETATVTVTFSEAVAAFDETDLTAANGVISALAVTANTSIYNGTFTPTDNIEDTTNIITLGTTYTDTAGNAPLATVDSANYTIDTKEPTLVSGVFSSSTLSIGETTLVTLIFSEAVGGFNNSDLTIPNGALTAVSSADGNITWTAFFTATDDIEDPTNVLTVAMTGVNDFAGNPGLDTANSSNYIVDTKEPTLVSGIFTDPTLTVGQTSVVTFIFHEAISGLKNGNMTIANGVLTTIESADGGLTWTATFTPTDNIEDVTNIISINMSTVNDAAGNAGLGIANSSNYVVDTKEPTVLSIILNDSDLKVGETANLTVTFSEAVAGFTNADLTVANGELTTISSEDNITWNATFTPTDDLEDATNVITLGTGWTDAAGNAPISTTDSANYTIDTKEPTLTSGVFTDNSLIVGETSLVTFTFSEAVSGFTNDDLTIANGGLTAVSSGDGGITWTATFTPTDDLEDANNVITVAMTGVTDAAGNAGLGTSDTSNYAIDTKEPTGVSVVLSDSDLKVGETATVTVTFSEAVTGFNETDLTVANGAMGAVTVTGDPLIYTGTFTPTDNIEDTTNIITLGTTYTDTAGNAPLATVDSANYTIDTKEPTVAITSSDYEFKVADTATLTFTFSEEPTGFTVDDITAANGALTDFTVTGNPLIYTATFTPTDNLEDATNVVTVGVGWTDAAGNAPISTTDSANYTIDTKEPTLTSGVFTDNSLIVGETSLVTFTFSEAVSGFANSDLTIANGGLTAVSSGDGGITYTATFTPTDDIENATNVITVAMTGVTDAAGNAGLGTSDTSNYAIDTKEPTGVSVVLNDSDLKVGETATVTVTFSEAVAAFDETDLTAANGVISALAVTANTSIYNGTFTPTDNIEDTTNIITLGTTYTDTAGNAPLATVDSANYTIDTKEPTVAITSSDYEFKVADTATLTFTFSEEPTGFTVDDITAANGALTDFTVTGDPLIYTATFTPTDDLEDATNVVTVGVGWTDAAGNAPISTTDSANYTIDTKEPTGISVVLSDSDLKSGETATVTVTFSEAVTGFDETDLTVANGAMGAVTVTGNPLIYTGTFTPTDNIEDTTNIITLGTGYTDLAGNAPLATLDSANYTIDTLYPTLVSGVVSDTSLNVGEMSTVTFTFSQAVTGFTNADLTIGNGVLTAVSSSDGGTTWTAFLTPTDDVEDPTNVITVDMTGVTDAGGNTGVGTSDTNNYAIDTKEPTLTSGIFTDNSLIVGETSLVTFVFHERVAGFTNADLTIANGILTAVTTADGGITWTATFTPTDDLEDATNVITVALTGLNDSAGNPGVGTANTSNYAIDTKEPTIVSLTLNDSALKVGETALVTITLSEAATGLDENDLTVANGLMGAVTATANTSVYTGVFTPTDNIEAATNVMSLGTGWTDVAGNAPLAGADSANYAIDTIEPTVTVELNDSALRIGETATVNFTFSEVPTGFTVDDVTAGSGALTGFSVTANTSVYTATFTPTDDLEDATNVVTVGVDWTDAAGNAPISTTDSANYEVDTKEPVGVSVVLDDSDLIVGETATVTISFSEPVSGFAVEDLTAANGALSGFSVTANTSVYTATFTPTDNIEDATNVITLAMTYTDIAGNAPLAATDSANYTIDTIEPVGVSVTLNDSALRVGETANVTITFSEAVSGFDETDLTAANGVITGITVTANTSVYVGVFTPTDNIEDADNIITLGTDYTDLAGNAPLATVDSANYEIDTKEPTLTSGVFADDELIVGETSLVTFTFSEAVSGFTNGDLTIANGGLTAVSSGDGGITWTATFTPTDDLEDANNVITVAMTGVTDAAGNAGLGTSDTNNYAIDTKEPIGVSVVLDDSDLIAGETATVTITFSEAVTGFDEDDLTAASGAMGEVTVTGDPLIYTGTFTPTADTEDATNIITLETTYTDLAGNAPLASTNSSNYTVETLRPTVIRVNVSDTNITENDVGLNFSVNVSYSEAMDSESAPTITFDPTLDTTLIDCAGVWMNTTVYQYNCTIADANISTDEGVDIDTTAAEDAAGNAQNDYTAETPFYVDTTSCALFGDYAPCYEPGESYVSLSEVVDLIDLWVSDGASLSQVVALINAWVG